jgi:hypothetical protein
LRQSRGNQTIVLLTEISAIIVAFAVVATISSPVNAQMTFVLGLRVRQETRQNNQAIRTI